jgi:dCTP deaminase
MTTSEPQAAPAVGTLTDQEIVELGRSGALITEGFEQDNVQQACYELRAGRVFYEPDKGNRRQTVAEGADLLIKPKQLVVIITMESLDLPTDMLGRVLLKGRMFSLGLMPVNTYADPGFSGKLGIVLFNASNNYLRIRPGEAIAKIEFCRLARPVARPDRGQHGYQSEIWPLAEHMILSERESGSDQRIGDPVDELTRAYGRDFGAVLERVFRFERYLILSAIVYVLFSLVLFALTQASTSKRLSVVAAIALGVVANAVTSILTIAATSLRRRRRARDPA